LLGASVQDISPDLADAVGLATVTGAIVTYIAPNSPATEAGLHDGDVILKLDDTTISNSRTARRFVTARPGASGVRIQILRDGTETTLTANLREVSMGPERVDMAMQPVAKMRLTAMDLGVEAAPMSDALRAKFKIAPEIDGIVITAVIEKGLGAYLGLQQGSVLIQAQGTVLHSAQDFIGVAERALQQNRARIPLLVSDTLGSRWIALPVSR
jgi:serine protease Do